MPRNITGPHDPQPDCHASHCYSCGLDHDGGAWKWCIECGHAWMPGELRRAFRRGLLDDTRLRERPLLRSNEWHDSIARVLWRAVTVRASRVPFCPLCLHDF